MVSAPDEDFASFLEYGDLPLDFPAFEGVADDGRTVRQDVDADVTMDIPMENAPAMADFGMAHVPQQPEPSISNPLMGGYNGNMSQLFDMPMSRDHFPHNLQPQAHVKRQRQYPPCMVPPTPNSIEMHGGMPGYYTTPMHQQPRVYEHYHRSQRDQVSQTEIESSLPLILTERIDDLHAVGFACGHASGYSIPVRSCSTGRKLQSLDVAGP